MDSQGKEAIEEDKNLETPEDVAVLYSWANLHGAKYRDFSASRREYRAQMRWRAAEKQREEELTAKDEAEAAATAADAAAHTAQENARRAAELRAEEHKQAILEVEEATGKAAAERIEAARRAEAAAIAEAEAQRAEQEMMDAHASAQRQAARYAESGIRRRALAGPQPQASVPREISDPYTPENQQPASVEHRYRHPHTPGQVAAPMHASSTSSDLEPTRYRSKEYRAVASVMPAASMPPAPMMRNPEVCNADRQRPRNTWRLYAEQREAEAQRAEHEHANAEREMEQERLECERRDLMRERETAKRGQAEQPQAESNVQQPDPPGAYRPEPIRTRRPSVYHLDEPSREMGAYTVGEESSEEGLAPRRLIIPAVPVASLRRQAAPPPPDIEPYRAEPYRPPAQRREPRIEIRQPAGMGESTRYAGASVSRPGVKLPSDELLERMKSIRPAGVEAGQGGDEPVGPAWLYPTQEEKRAPEENLDELHDLRAREQSRIYERAGGAPVADTLQHSRERVAARWFALKGVFEHGANEATSEPQSMRQKEMRTPVLAVFSLAGGVGKTSLVATLGRALSSLGEKVLLTDTTSQGLLPFYFGASTSSPGVVRTFSPPTGSTDAPIYLVSYDVSQNAVDQGAQEWLADELSHNGRGMQRVLLDLSGSSGWVARRLARMSPTVLVPVAPDMNSVISLQSVEKFFAGVTDAVGRSLQPFYLLNQFDATLPLHPGRARGSAAAIGRPVAAVCDSPGPDGGRSAGGGDDSSRLCSRCRSICRLHESGVVAAIHIGPGDSRISHPALE